MDRPSIPNGFSFLTVLKAISVLSRGSVFTSEQDQYVQELYLRAASNWHRVLREQSTGIAFDWSDR